MLCTEEEEEEAETGEDVGTDEEAEPNQEAQEDIERG